MTQNKTLYFEPKTPLQPTEQFRVIPNQPKTLEMKPNPLDGVFRQIRDGENKRENDLNRFDKLFSQLTNLLNFAEKEIGKIKREHFSFRDEIESLIAGVNGKIDSLKIPKSQDKELRELNDKMTGLLNEIKTIKKTSEGVAGGTGSQIIVRRKIGKLLGDKPETPRGTIDGSNKDFYLTRAPFGGFIILVANGVQQTKDDDFTLDGAKISYTTALPTGSNHQAIFF